MRPPRCDGFSYITCSHHPRCRTTLHLLEQTLDRCGEDTLTINTLDGPVTLHRLFPDKNTATVRINSRFSWHCGSNPDKDWTTCPDKTLQAKISFNKPTDVFQIDAGAARRYPRTEGTLTQP